jgi:hypothetical protein
MAPFNRQIKGSANRKAGPPHTSGPGQEENIIYSSSYDGSFSAFFCVYALQFYDAFSFYHKASLKRFFVKELF